MSTDIALNIIYFTMEMQRHPTNYRESYRLPYITMNLAANFRLHFWLALVICAWRLDGVEVLVLCRPGMPRNMGGCNGGGCPPLHGLCKLPLVFATVILQRLESPWKSNTCRHWRAPPWSRPQAPPGAQRPGCRGGSRYVAGCRGFPCVKKLCGFVVSWFLVSWFVVSWFIGFLVSWSLGFLVSWLFVFLGFFVGFGFLVSWFQRFKASFNVIRRYFVNITNFPFYVFLIDIDLMSKIFCILLHGSSSFLGERLSQHFQMFRNSIFCDIRK